MAKGKKKFVFVVLDGAADRPCKDLQNKTPFQISFKPNLDWFTENGKCGVHYPIKKGIAPESDSAVMALLGYDPEQYFTGRGPLEAMGAGIPLKRGDLALRANFTTVKKGKLLDRRVGRTLTTAEAEVLSKTLNKKVKLGFPFIFKHTIEHRGVLVVRGGFSANITNVDPAYKRHGKYAVAVKEYGKINLSKPMDDDEVTQLSANLVNNFTEQSHKLLSKHSLNLSRIRNGLLPANIIVTRNAGVELPDLPKRREKWIAPLSMPLEIALANLAGMNVKKFAYPEMISPNPYKNIYYALKNYLQFTKKVMTKEWNNCECFYIHVKETDVPGHDGQGLHKKKMIEMIDEMLFGFLRKKNVTLCVTSDHTTPSSLKAHSADPVPFMIYGADKDGIKTFDEKNCAKGKFKTIFAKDLLKLALD
ncbi:alkaline phosphatase family protein [Nanoarchaeota archaeon]